MAVGPIDGGENVRAVAGAADGEEKIAGAAVVHELLEEDLVVAAVVADGEEPAGVVGEAEDFEAFFGFVVQVAGAERAFAEVFGYVAGGGGAAAVADDENEAAVLPGFIDEVGPFLDVRLA